MVPREQIMDKKAETFEDIIVWQKAEEFVKEAVL